MSRNFLIASSFRSETFSSRHFFCRDGFASARGKGTGKWKNDEEKGDRRGATKVAFRRILNYSFNEANRAGFEVAGALNRLVEANERDQRPNFG